MTANDSHAPSAAQLETIEVVYPADDPTLRWRPIVGHETMALIRHIGLPSASSQQLVSEAAAVLGRSIPPTAADGRDTGLVLGYVQSGKTMSFTTVAALARDNGYRLIIVGTGLTVNLFTQSKERLEHDLRLKERNDRHWLFLANPPAREHVQQTVAMALEADDDLPGLPQQTVLIAVMKNGTHLDNVRRLLEKLPLYGVPALLIDDEADQASLNNLVQEGGETATYRRMVQLRNLFPHGTFLQYTATPQAPLLINLIDVLSPSFAEVLTPGPSYTGGDVFFDDGRELVRPIPPSDIPSPTNVLSGPPDSLIEAMRVFLLGVAAGMRGGALGNRSMMVHPSAKTVPHGDYSRWVTEVKENWRDVLDRGPGEPDYGELVQSFAETHADLAKTVLDLPSLDDLLPYLKAAARRTIVTEVNATRGKTPQADWRQVYSHIVVGGQVLNRGYTIEGLTVTYMPRGMGTRQADTIQQRARWFGYKEDYLGFCRVYLSDPLISAYEAYVDHEERLRKQLREHRATGKSLRDWRRAFFLDANLRPTRNSIIDVDLQRGSFSDEWYAPKTPHEPTGLPTNRAVVSSFLASLERQWRPDEGDARRTPTMVHNVARGVSLDRVHRDLLTQLRSTGVSDSPRFTGLLLQIARYLENHPDARCTVYRMSPSEQRERSLDGDGEIPNLFQGANYDETKDPREETYPGDRLILTPGQLTVQIHMLTVKDGDRRIDEVPAVAVWVPAAMARDWVVQQQGT
jgi:Z1 domain